VSRPQQKRSKRTIGRATARPYKVAKTSLYITSAMFAFGMFFVDELLGNPFRLGGCAKECEKHSGAV